MKGENNHGKHEEILQENHTEVKETPLEDKLKRHKTQMKLK